jgi:osmotically-inducible protein OsmY
MSMRTMTTLVVSLAIASGLASAQTVQRENRNAPEAQDPAQANPTDAQRRSNDTLLATEVERQLAGDPSLSALKLRVEVHDGLVTLSGPVDRAEDKQRAEAAVRHVAGVRDVRNEVRVEPAGQPAAGTSAIPEQPAR